MAMDEGGMAARLECCTGDLPPGDPKGGRVEAPDPLLPLPGFAAPLVVTNEALVLRPVKAALSALSTTLSTTRELQFYF